MAVEVVAGQRERVAGKQRLLAAAALRAVADAPGCNPVRGVAMSADDVYGVGHGNAPG
jgi:hypothetical protein